MLMRHTLIVLVALAIVGLFVLVALFLPSAPPARIGVLPVRTGSFMPAMVGTYIAPCGGGSAPIRWAVFLYQSNQSNVTFHLAGAWRASRPTAVDFGFSMNLSSTDLLRVWMPFAHCPLILPGESPPLRLPTLPTAGLVDYNVTTLPTATLFLLTFRTFDPYDVVEVTEPFTVTPA